MIHISITYKEDCANDNVSIEGKFVISIVNGLSKKLRYANHITITIGKGILTITRSIGGKSYIPFDCLDLNIEEDTKSRLVEQRSLKLLYGGS